ncbi:hypothetical protein [Elizabethkingia meningoseptica]|uniref:hypothetical protein n=2 Tax=Elizabethkingia meningoseptica TaxID=238 RepID=UPI0020113FC2|nr:hypothetical protein [Elizabethkingia meningoseptica]MCL1675599.1 hypothetical protein [Elizabethkingia meningoseptica]MCL1686985.1 hypothetical protein [Elizabethkingia meningoseptica]
MREFFTSITILSSLFIFAKDDLARPFIAHNYNKDISLAFAPKFAYAEMVFQHYYKDKAWVNGKYVDDNIRAAVSKVSSPSQALDIMGDNGWELTTSFTRNFDGGYEYYYYFKKVIN